MIFASIVVSAMLLAKAQADKCPTVKVQDKLEMQKVTF